MLVTTRVSTASMGECERQQLFSLASGRSQALGSFTMTEYSITHPFRGSIQSTIRSFCRRETQGIHRDSFEAGWVD